MRYDLYTGEEKMLHLPTGSDVLKGKENIIFVTGEKAEELDVYRINDDFSLTYLSTIRDGKIFSVSYLDVCGDEIYVYVVFDWENFFMANESFYYSSDRGKNWKKLGTMGHSQFNSDIVTSYVDNDGFKIVCCDYGFSVNIFWNRNISKRGT